MTDITPSSQPSRLHTPVTVEIYHHHQPSRYMGFSDTQNAYQWIRDQVRGNNESHLRLFPDVCEKLDYEYSKNGLRGYVVVASVPAVQFCLYYGQLTIGKIEVAGVAGVMQLRMDYIKPRKKKDKAKEKFQRNGGHSQKHIRLSQAIQEKKNNK